MSNDDDEVSRIYAKMRKIAGASGNNEVVVSPLLPSVTQVGLPTATLPPATHTSMYVIGQRALILVDVGAWSGHIAAAIDAAIATHRDAGAFVVALLATHHHGDHIGGMAQAAAHWRVPILAHPNTLARAPQLAPCIPLSSGAVPLVDMAWQAVHTPGHADGHLCLDAPELGVTIVGDMVAGEGTILIDPSDGDLTDYLASLAHLAALGPRRLLPSHGPTVQEGQAKYAGYRAHRLAREAKVLAALAEPSVIEDGWAPRHALLPWVYADTSPTIWPLAERSLLSHLAKLVREGRAVARGDSQWKLAP